MTLFIIGRIDINNMNIFKSLFSKHENSLSVEQASVIRRVSDGYPITANESEKEELLQSGEYYDDNEFLDGGFWYSEGSDTVFVPDGYRVARK